ncbi:MAG: pyridoxamine 5'-phosphate oxidase family protein [Aquihabitans sp.]
MGETALEIIERRECLELLAGQQVGRLAVMDGDAPLILPLNYALVDDTIVFETNDGSKLDASRGGPACFEIDGIDPEHLGGWSVVVRGHLHEVTEYDQPALDKFSNRVDPWIGERSHLLRLDSWAITGRRLRGRAAGA